MVLAALCLPKIQQVVKLRPTRRGLARALAWPTRRSNQQMQSIVRAAVGGRPNRVTPSRLKFHLARKVQRSDKSRAGCAEAGDLVSLTDSDLRRFEALALLDRRVITVTEAQHLLRLSRSQVYKLLFVLRTEGPRGVRKKRRGRASNRAFPKSIRVRVIGLIEAHYPDYGPTLASEILAEVHGIRRSRETLRQWMIAAGIWIKNRVAQKRLHQPRKRKPAYGDLVQIDGSDHRWFEDRAPRCTAMVMVDDATGCLQMLRFFPQEDRDAYYQSLYCYVAAHGRPFRILTDRHSAVWSPHGTTEFSEALRRLNIVHSFAWSPQSKGRVERTHRTLQDRLVKELRRRGICSLEAANAFVPEFVRAYNRRFGKPAAEDGDNHRPLIAPRELDAALSVRHTRRVTRNLTFSFRGRQYLIEAAGVDRDAVGPRVTVEVRLDKTMAVFGKCGQVTVRTLDGEA
jgi:hypothetical protein